MKADPMVPKTPAADAALSVATRFCSPALLNHSLRCCLWGAMYGAAHGIAFDDELYYVSALLHDVGLTETFDSHRLPFEDAGAQLAWVFGVAAGWPGQRAARVAEIIVLHMRDDVSPADDAESHLLQVATSWEAVGRRPEEFPPDARALSPSGIRGGVSRVLRGPGEAQAGQRRRLLGRQSPRGLPRPPTRLTSGPRTPPSGRADRPPLHFQQQRAPLLGPAAGARHGSDHCLPMRVQRSFRPARP
jgi:HD domain